MQPLAPSETVPVKRKSPKAPSLDSRTGKLFMKYFIYADPDSYPIKLPTMTRGAAINLSVGLNRINKEYFGLNQPGAEKANASLSAKAKAVSGEEESRAARAACRAGLPVPPCGDWYVEISESNLRTGKISAARAASSAWMDRLLEEAERAIPEPVPKPRPLSSDEAMERAMGIWDKKDEVLTPPIAGAAPTPSDSPKTPWLMQGKAAPAPKQEDKTVMLTKAEVEARLATKGEGK